MIWDQHPPRLHPLSLFKYASPGTAFIFNVLCSLESLLFGVLSTDDKTRWIVLCQFLDWEDFEYYSLSTFARVQIT